MTISRAALRAWAAEPRIAALDEWERLDAAVAEGMLVLVPAPAHECAGDECEICQGSGNALVLGDGQ